MKMRYAGLSPSTAWIAVLSVLVLFAFSSASAQTTTLGTIEGTVTDPKGAAVPGMTVTATRQGGRGSSATTNDKGLYRMLNLEPGRYTVTVEAEKGFARFQQANVEVNLSRTTNVNAQLRPVSTETITVPSSSGTAGDEPTPTTASNNPGKVTTSGGLTTVTFESIPGLSHVSSGRHAGRRYHLRHGCD